MMAAVPVTLADIQQAREELAGVVRMTQVVPASHLATLVGGPVWMKCENLQAAGSFKVRGAFVRMLRLGPEVRDRGVVAASAGNHAQGVAVAARRLGVSATVFMPVGAPLPKVTATRSYGAQVVLMGATVEESLDAAAEHAARTGAILIHPFDHEDVVAGQGTVALEVLEQVPDVATVLVPTGGGGLLAGVAAALAQAAPHVAVVGVQAAGAAAYPGSLAAGSPIQLAHLSTMADGIAVGRPGAVPFRIISKRALRILTVSEEAISRALLLVLERDKLLVEPAGAVGVAALLEESGLQPPVVVILSGGNVDPLLLVRVMEHGLVAAGRYLTLRARLGDHPGALADLLGEVAALGANVISVEHERMGAGLMLGEVDVRLHLETRGPEHCRAVAEGLSVRGWPIVAER